MERRLRKSNNKMLAGVCAGLGEYLNLNPTLVRVIYAVLTLFTAGFPGLILYLILCVIMPAPEGGDGTITK